MSAFRPALPLLLLALGAATSPAAAEETKSFQDWTLVCEDSGPVENRNCLVSAVALDPETKAQVLGVAVGAADKASGLHMAIKTAPQVRKDAGVEFQVDKGRVYSAPFAGCTKEACVLRFPMPDELVASLRKGKTMTVVFAPEASKEKVGASVSLKGISAALDAMAARRSK
ncbi:invasion associated locus B family protein [Azospirillum sp. ST 5-10]|uniref:invasion associated locus B family protein n=1 Tax=unclassified Azospirillum TaxID=2630922 RepID=UPI003F49C0F7